MLLESNGVESASAATSPIRFKDKYTFAHRNMESARVQTKYPDRVPVILEKAARSRVMALGRQKFLVPRKISVGQFLLTAQTHLATGDDQPHFLLSGHSVLRQTERMQDVYDRDQDTDGFLYLAFADHIPWQAP